MNKPKQTKQVNEILDSLRELRQEAAHWMRKAGHDYKADKSMVRATQIIEKYT